jgi:HAD superfamily hydrolase (TIGR01459 family)
VLHNGVAAFPPAVDALQRYRAGGGRVVLITNAPRPAGSVQAQLDGLGVPRDAYDRIVTSGDVTRGLIADLGRDGIAHLGPERDAPLFEGLDPVFVALHEASWIVCTGLVDDTVETPDDYADMLADAHARGATMICANPDIVVQRGADLVYCAGALGRAYETVGGRVIYAGKPHPPIYEHCFAVLREVLGREVARPEVLAIGDGLPTDVLGAERFGLDLLYVADGIHRADIVGPDGAADPERLAALFENARRPPVAAVFGLGW